MSFDLNGGIAQIIDIVLHVDKYLGTIIQDYGTWTYGILFFIIFMETGFVITPFLPGDSLLFAAGSFAGIGVLNPYYLFFLLWFAAVSGDNLNYWIGHKIGESAVKKNSRLIKKEYLDKTHNFYEKHGGKTVILARFVPIIRTFMPFVAGLGAMTYPKFLIFDIMGGALWVGIFVFAGYFFGGLSIVKENFSIVIVVIILISVVPIITEFIKHKIKKTKSVDKNAG